MIYLIRISFVYILLVIVLVLVGIFSIFAFKRPSIFHFFGKSFSIISFKILGLKALVQGEENIPDKPAIYIFNHQNILDVCLYGHYPVSNTLLVGKKEMTYIPFLGFAYWASGNIILNRQEPRKAYNQLQNAASAVLKKGYSMRLFPEGTRNSHPDKFLSFKKGAFLLASQTGAPIVPVVTSNYSSLFNPYKRVSKSGTVVIKIMEPIYIKNGDSASIKEQADVIRESMYKAYGAISS